MKTKFLIQVLLLIFAVFCCDHSQACMKYVFPGEVQEIQKEDVEAVNGLKSETDNVYTVTLVLSEKAQKEHHMITQKYAGNYVSIYFGDILLWPDLYMPEPMNKKEMNIVMPSQEMMWKVIEYYSKPDELKK
jgi:hypothetical protein